MQFNGITLAGGMIISNPPPGGTTKGIFAFGYVGGANGDRSMTNLV